VAAVFCETTFFLFKPAAAWAGGITTDFIRIGFQIHSLYLHLS
jgi:hypothetical protein